MRIHLWHLCTLQARGELVPSEMFHLLLLVNPVKTEGHDKNSGPVLSTAHNYQVTAPLVRFCGAS